jgi:DNA-directed RNA polymerase subunit RPC12/RpoP
MGMNIYESINAIMAECPVIAKAQQNKQQGFMYRGVDVVMNVFQPLLAKYKVFVVPEVLDTMREERQTKNGGNLIYTILKVKYTFYAEDGSCVAATVQGEGMDSADKSGNKAMSVAFKYAMFQVFCIPTEEMRDPDAESHDESTPTVYACADCGKVFEPYTDNKGKTWSAKQVYYLAQQRNADGVARCAECRKKLEAKEA